MPNSIRWLDGKFTVREVGANIEYRIHSGAQEYVFQTSRQDVLG